MKTGLTEVKIGKVTPEVNVYENTQIKTQGNTPHVEGIGLSLSVLQGKPLTFSLGNFAQQSESKSRRQTTAFSYDGSFEGDFSIIPEMSPRKAIPNGSFVKYLI